MEMNLLFTRIIKIVLTKKTESSISERDFLVTMTPVVLSTAKYDGAFPSPSREYVTWSNVFCQENKTKITDIFY